MTYLVYALWFISLLWVVGEIDQRWTRRLTERWVPELAAANVWFLPPAVSLALPGAGQFLNNQPVKALLCLSWPVLMAGIVPRPFQFLLLHTWELLLPWWLLVFLDALAVGLLHHYREAQENKALRQKEAGTRGDLSEFLARRKSGR